MAIIKQDFGELSSGGKQYVGSFLTSATEQTFDVGFEAKYVTVCLYYGNNAMLIMSDDFINNKEYDFYPPHITTVTEYTLYNGYNQGYAKVTVNGNNIKIQNVGDGASDSSALGKYACFIAFG